MICVIMTVEKGRLKVKTFIHDRRGFDPEDKRQH